MKALDLRSAQGPTSSGGRSRPNRSGWRGAAAILAATAILAVVLGSRTAKPPMPVGRSPIGLDAMRLTPADPEDPAARKPAPSIAHPRHASATDDLRPAPATLGLAEQPSH